MIDAMPKSAKQARPDSFIRMLSCQRFEFARICIGKNVTHAFQVTVDNLFLVQILNTIRNVQKLKFNSIRISGIFSEENTYQFDTVCFRVGLDIFAYVPIGHPLADHFEW